MRPTIGSIQRKRKRSYFSNLLKYRLLLLYLHLECFLVFFISTFLPNKVKLVSWKQFSGEQLKQECFRLGDIGLIVICFNIT